MLMGSLASRTRGGEALCNGGVVTRLASGGKSRAAEIVAGIIVALSLPATAAAQAVLTAAPVPPMLWRVPSDVIAPNTGTADGDARCAATTAVAAGPAIQSDMVPGTHLSSLLAAAIAMPLCHRRALVLTAHAVANPELAPLRLGGYRAGAALAVSSPAGSTWLGYRESVAPFTGQQTAAPDSGRLPAARTTVYRDALHELTLGLTRRINGLALSVSTGAARGVLHEERTGAPRSVTDSVWSDTLGWTARTYEVPGQSVTHATAAHWITGELEASFTGARFTAVAGLGGWMAGARTPSIGWGTFEMAARLQSGVWLVGAVGARPELSRFAGAHGGYATLGLRLAHRARTPASAEDAESRSAPRRLEITPLDAGTYRVSVFAPAAREVALSGDFTHWQPLALTRAADGAWCTLLDLAPGPHRLNIRIDDGPWTVPPGTTAVPDDFGGSAGLVLVPAQ